MKLASKMGTNPDGRLLIVGRDLASCVEAESAPTLQYALDNWSVVQPGLVAQHAALIWEGHKAGREIGYCHLEKLHNLEALPAVGYTVCCFPVKIRRASAGWTRAVAILDESPAERVGP